LPRLVRVNVHGSNAGIWLEASVRYALAEARSPRPGGEGVEEALKTLEQSLAIYREVGNRAGEAVTLNNISQIYHAWGRYEEARTGRRGIWRRP
jgi:hypothetical protein